MSIRFEHKHPKQYVTRVLNYINQRELGKKNRLISVAKSYFSENPNNLLQVADVMFGSTDIHYTPSNTVLQGRWSIVHKQGSPPNM